MEPIEIIEVIIKAKEAYKCDWYSFDLKNGSFLGKKFLLKNIE